MPRWPRHSPVANSGPLSADAAGAAAVAVEVIDPTVYDAVFRRSIDAIYRICLAVLHDADAADDATGAVLEKLVKSLPKAEVHDIDRWLSRVARNAAVDHLRAMKRRRESQGPLVEAETVEDPSPTPEDLALNEALGRHLKEHLACLSPDQRQVVELRTEGLSAKEVAELLGRNYRWVDTTYFRALRKLRERLAAEAERRGEQ